MARPRMWMSGFIVSPQSWSWSLLGCRLPSWCGGEAVAAHYGRECREVGRAGDRGVEDGCDFAEEVGAKDAGGDDRQRSGVDVAGVVEVVGGATRDDEYLAGADVDWRALECPGHDALKPVDRLLVAVVAVRGCDLRADGNVKLEHRHRPCRLVAFNQKPDCHVPNLDLVTRGGCHRGVLPS